MGTTATERETKARDRPALTPIEKPIYPRCGVGSFGRPTVSRGPAGGWRLIYLRPSAPAVRGVTTFVQIEEHPPDVQRDPPENARTIRVRGRVVRIIRQGRAAQPAFIGQWGGKRARYVAIVNGEPTRILRKLAGCTP